MRRARCAPGRLVVVTGAQGLIPERAEPYAIQLQWRLDGSDWKLIELHWE